MLPEEITDDTDDTGAERDAGAGAERAGRDESAVREGRATEGVPSKNLESGETPAAASVRGVSKSFKKTRVLEDVSFDVGVGEALVLLGASGSGKT
ncbi:MAG: hypothetical protein QOJ76_3474, partial [Acidobacteriota bacterium]|nr:hypothetical protein [Acidobacteriota bacterium]